MNQAAAANKLEPEKTDLSFRFNTLSLHVEMAAQTAPPCLYAIELKTDFIEKL
jgi:hypothetical protein